AQLRQRSRVQGRVIFPSFLRGAFPGRSLLGRSPPRSEELHAADFRQLALKRLRPAQQVSLVCLTPAECPGQQTLIGSVREQLSFFDRRRTVQSAELNEARHHSIEQRRADRTFADRKKFVRAEPEVPQRKSGRGLGRKLRRTSHLQPRPVAKIPRRRRVQPNLSRQFNLRDPP